MKRVFVIEMHGPVGEEELVVRHMLKSDFLSTVGEDEEFLSALPDEVGCRETWPGDAILVIEGVVKPPKAKVKEWTFDE